jgi:cyclopropane fatty-acyl-phospholipid synthase-like methyltransferase
MTELTQPPSAAAGEHSVINAAPNVHPAAMLEPPTADHGIIWDIYFSSHILPLVAFADEIGIFSSLEASPLSIEDAAREFQISEEWAEILLGALASLQLIRLQDGRFHNGAAARSFFLPDGPYYAGFTLRYFATRNTFERLQQAVWGRPSSPPLPATSAEATVYQVREWSDADYTLERAERSARTMHGLSFPGAVALARNADFSGVRRLLDVAGGAGGFSIALAQRYPNLRCTVAELPIVCQVSRRYIDKYGVEDRVDTLAFNMFFDEWPTGYDAIFFSCALHDWDLSHRLELMQRAFQALPSGGAICIHEMLLSDLADGPIAPALYSLSMRIGTLGKQFTVPELRQALERVGFTHVTVQNTTHYFSLLSARKP